MSYCKMDEMPGNSQQITLGMIYQNLHGHIQGTNEKIESIQQQIELLALEIGQKNIKHPKEKDCDLEDFLMIVDSDGYEGPPVFDEDPNQEDHDLEEQKIILEALGILEVQAKGPQTPIIALELFDESSKKEEVKEETELDEKYEVQGCSTTYFFVEGDHKPDYGQRTKIKKVRPGIYTITTTYDLYQHNRDTSLEIMMFDSSHDWGGDNQVASELIKTEVEPILEQYRPMISSMKFYKLTLGTVALQFTRVFIIEAGCDEGIMMEMEMQWDGTRVSVALPVQVKNTAFNGVFRLIFKPLVDELPCFGAVSFSLRLTLKVISGDISAIPGISIDLVVVIVSTTCGVLLTLLDNLYPTSSHSIFFNSLQTRGFKLDFKLAEDPNLTLQRYGQYWYDALILFSPTTDRFGGSLDLIATLDFSDSGHDVIVAADEDAYDLIHNIAAECGIDFDEDSSTVVIDDISYAISEIDGDHTVIAADDFIQSDVILGSARIETPVLFKGVRHSLNPANSLVLKVLSGSSSSYSANPKHKLFTPPTLTQSTISLVSIVHARHNARILFSGSLDLFSISFFKSSVQKAGSSIRYKKSDNEQFVTELSKWVFHERGHLMAVNVRHNKVGESEEPAMYRINDELEYLVEIYEWSGTRWKSYVSSDVQSYMMRPYVLQTLSTDQKGLYHLSMKGPDVYGILLRWFTLDFQTEIVFKGENHQSDIAEIAVDYCGDVSSRISFLISTREWAYLWMLVTFVECARKLTKVDGTVELRGVQFCYPSRPDVLISKDFDLRVHIGKTMALVGQSGSGKSSVLASILQFYDPLAGIIIIDAKGRNSLETYIYNMKNKINDKDKLADKLESDEKEKIDTAVKEVLEWLDDHQSAGKKDYDEKLKEVEVVCNPIIIAVTIFDPGGNLEIARSTMRTWLFSKEGELSGTDLVQGALKMGRLAKTLAAGVNIKRRAKGPEDHAVHGQGGAAAHYYLVNKYTRVALG